MQRRFSRLVAPICLFACIGAPTHAAPTPQFDLVQFFDGRFEGSGTFTDIQHPTPLAVTFTGEGTPIAGGLDLDYVLAFSDGETTHEMWTFLKQGDDQYIGRRGDVVGDARIVPSGDGFAMSYTGRVATKGGQTVNLHFNEQYTLTGPDQIENKVEASLVVFPVVSGDVIIHKVGG